MRYTVTDNAGNTSTHGADYDDELMVDLAERVPGWIVMDWQPDATDTAAPFRLDTFTGLTGQILAYVQLRKAAHGTIGFAVVIRDGVADLNRPYSTHVLTTYPDGRMAAELGDYDLTQLQAFTRFAAEAARIVAGKVVSA